MKLAQLTCKQDMIIYGRNQNGEPDKCFSEGNTYLFCLDEKKNDIFIYNDVKEVHSMKLNTYFTDKHFDLITVGELEAFNLDEFTAAKMKRLYKERYDYSE